MKKSRTTFFYFIFLLMIISGSALSQEQKEGFKPFGKVWGMVFGDIFYKAAGDTTGSFVGEYTKTDVYKNAFDFRRIYLGFNYEISEKFSSEFIAAFDGTDYLPNGKRSLYVKIANIKWKDIYPNATLVLGQLSTPTYSYTSEKLYGYRWLEKTILDMKGIASSHDFGLAVLGKFDQEGKYGYNLMIGNGRGALVENNKFKKYYAGLYGYFWDKKILADVYSDYEDINSNQNKTTLKSFIGFQNNEVRIGFEIFNQLCRRFYSDGSNKSTFGFSIFSVVTLIENKIYAFGRFDYIDPDLNHSDLGYKENFLIVGANFVFDKNIHFMPNLWVNMYKDKSAANVERKADIVPRLTFYYLYK